MAGAVESSANWRTDANTITISPASASASDEIHDKAVEILTLGDPLDERVKYVQRHHHGDTLAIKATILIANSAFLDEENRLHGDIVGDKSIGKSDATVRTLGTFPPKNVKIVSEASPMSLYYYAKDHSLHQTILYIDDAREDHVPLLKTFRNDGSSKPVNLTVKDGASLELDVKDRPVTFASSVKPLRDLEGQATSRAFMITFETPGEGTKHLVKQTIRNRHRYGRLNKREEDEAQKILQETTRITLAEGTSHVLIPFDAKEPMDGTYRDTAQFQRLIASSAHMRQYRRPVLNIDGERYVLATYEDLETAADVWFAFMTPQQFKISEKAREILSVLPTSEPNPENPAGWMTSSGVHAKTRIPQSTCKVLLDDLYEAGLANRTRVKAPGSPWAYWVDEDKADLAKRALAKESTSGGPFVDLARFSQKPELAKYMAENSSDSLMDSIKAFFVDLANDRRNVIWIHPSGEEATVNSSDELYPLFLSNWLAKSKNVPDDSDHLAKNPISQILAESSEMPADIDIDGLVDSGQISGPVVLRRDDRGAQVLVRFRTDYETDVPRPGDPNAFDPVQFHAGETALVSRWRAERWVKGDICHLVNRNWRMVNGEWELIRRIHPGYLVNGRTRIHHRNQHRLYECALCGRGSSGDWRDRAEHADPMSAYDGPMVAHGGLCTWCQEHPGRSLFKYPELGVIEMGTA